MKIIIETLPSMGGDETDVDVVVDHQRHWCGSVRHEAPYRSLQLDMAEAYVAIPKAARKRPFKTEARALLWLAERCLAHEGLTA